MKKLKKNISNFLTLTAIGAVLTMSSCSSQKKNFFSKTYHNTTARYNAYFIAKENIKEVEAALETNHKNNYNKILGVFYDVDSATIDGVREKLDDCIVKASLAIQRHENSKWVDDSYYLIGKSRYYGGDFVNAIETFKYVNIHSEDKDTRHRALIALMRTFIDYNEHNNAFSVSDYLKKEELNRENQRDLELTKAYLYEVRGDYENAAKSLLQVVELEKTNKGASRYYFILGQIYQKYGADTAAYENYKRCLKSNPEYEMAFNAKLNLAQVSQIDKKVDIKKIRKYFKKLLKDEKNKEYVDKIYYEMANFELKNSDTDKAVEFYKSSVASSMNNPRQKSYSYLKLGEIYYDIRKNYEMAQAYYDSAVTTMPSEDEKYEATKARQVILNDFVKQVKTIQLQDSLLMLAKMDKDKLDQLLEKVIEEEKEKEKERQKEAKKRSKQAAAFDNNSFANNNPFGDSNTEGTDSEGSSWYFYNLNAVSTGRTLFLSRWGKRPLEDNWRRSTKEALSSFEETEETASVDSLQTEENVAGDKSMKEEKGRMMNTIPFSEEAKQESLKKIEDAYYNLGGIYNFQLEEKPNAIETYEKLLSRFPGSEYEPEVMYLLYLIYKAQNDPKQDGYKEDLIARHPKTLYAKLAINPNYQEESNETSERLQKLYKIAYDYYVQGDYDQAGLLVSRALEQYPDNEFSDHLRILNILIEGKVEGQYKYQYELQQFIENYPKSPLVDYAKDLLNASKEFKNNELSRKGANYISDMDQPHFFVVMYPNINNLSETVPKYVEEFVKKNYEGSDLKIGSLALNEGFSLVLVNKFDKKDASMKFYKKFVSVKSGLPELEKGDYTIFAITEDNFQIFFQTKKIEDYLKFFDEHYKH